MRTSLIVAALLACPLAAAQAPPLLPSPPSEAPFELWRHGLASDWGGQMAGAAGIVAADIDGDGRVEIVSLNGGRLLARDAVNYQSVHERQPDGTWRPVWAGPAPDVRALGHIVLEGSVVLLYVVATPAGGTELRAFDGRTRDRIATVPLTDDGGDRAGVWLTALEGDGADGPAVFVTGEGTIRVDPERWAVTARTERQVVVRPDLVGELDGTPGREIVQFSDIFDVVTLVHEGTLGHVDRGADTRFPLALYDVDGDGLHEALVPFFRRDSEFWIEAVAPATGVSAARWDLPRDRIFEVSQTSQAHVDRTGARDRLVFGTEWEVFALDLEAGGVAWATGVNQPVQVLAIADVDQDGQGDVVASGWSTLSCGGCGWMALDGHDGALTWAGSSFEGPWSNVAVADVDADGDPEAVYAVGSRRYAYVGHEDDPLGEYTYHDQEPLVVVADARTGEVERRCALLQNGGGWPQGHEPSLIWGFVAGLAVGEVDGEPGPDVVLAATHLYDPAVYVLDPVTCGLSPPVVFSGERSARLNAQGVALVDLDGDGLATAIVTGSARDGDDRVVPALYEVDLVRGEVLWSHTDPDLWGHEYSDPVVAEATGDGRPDVMVHRGLSGYVSLEATGAHVATFDLVTRTKTEVPTPGATGFAPTDRDGDGTVDAVVVSVTEVSSAGATQALRAYDLATGARETDHSLGAGTAGAVALLDALGLAVVASSSGTRFIDLETGVAEWADGAPAVQGADTGGLPTLSVAPGLHDGSGLFVSTVYGLRAFGLGRFGVGTSERPAPTALRVGPNPARGRIRVATPPARRVALFDMLGRQVAVATALTPRAEWELDVSRLAPGAYVVRAGWQSRLVTVVR